MHRLTAQMREFFGNSSYGPREMATAGMQPKQTPFRSQLRGLTKALFMGGFTRGAAKGVYDPACGAQKPRNKAWAFTQVPNSSVEEASASSSRRR